MLSTARNAGISWPCADTSGKKCWWWIIVVVSTSAGSAQELVGEGARHDRRVLDQVGHLVQRLLPRRRDADPPAAAARLGVELAADAVVAFAALEDDEVLGQPPPVVVEALDLDGAPGAPAGGQEAVAEGDRAGAHLLHQRPGARRRCGKSRTARRGRRRGTAPSGSAGRSAARPCRRRARRPSASASDTADRAARRRARPAARRRRPCRAAAAGAPGTRPSASRRAAAPGSTPCLRAKPRPAPVICPSAAKAADTGGPVTSSSKSVWRSGTRAARTTSRRGVLKVSTGAATASRSSVSRASMRAPNCAVSPGSQLAGSSSVPISINSSRSMVRRPGRSFARQRRGPPPRPRLRRRSRGTAAPPAGARAGCRRCAR